MRGNEAFAEKAKNWTNEMSSRYSFLISKSIKGTVTYGGSGKEVAQAWAEDKFSTEIILSDCDSVSAVMEFNEGKTALLNFASYKNPGGRFIDGMMAQEEAICHESFLYNVLRENMVYYMENRESLNGGFYTNRALYTPDVLFREQLSCDVITCAAPNASRMIRYKTGEEDKNLRCLAERILFIMNIAAEQKVDTLILGAFGCGVFKQNPRTVAAMFNCAINQTHKGLFKKVVFAIPNKNSDNYKAFEEAFKQ